MSDGSLLKAHFAGYNAGIPIANHFADSITLLKLIASGWLSKRPPPSAAPADHFEVIFLLLDCLKDDAIAGNL